MNSFIVHKPTLNEVPLILSVPHCGTDFPPELREEYKPELISAPDDTDWFVDQLYDFAPSMGITIIASTYSRWVIDLNRDPNNKALYSDGRIITPLCPATNFLGDPIYKDERKEVSEEDTKQRLAHYYWPYHEKLQELLDFTKMKFGRVLLWECHSIRQYVPTIYAEIFPDLILGDDDGHSADGTISSVALDALKSGSFSVSHNFPFKGGFITRNYGKPSENQQALQLEMTKVNYMDDQERSYHKQRAEKMRDLLKRVFEKLILSFTQSSQRNR